MSTYIGAVPEMTYYVSGWTLNLTSSLHTMAKMQYQ